MNWNEMLKEELTMSGYYKVKKLVEGKLEAIEKLEHLTIQNQVDVFGKNTAAKLKFLTKVVEDDFFFRKMKNGDYRLMEKLYAGIDFNANLLLELLELTMLDEATELGIEVLIEVLEKKGFVAREAVAVLEESHFIDSNYVSDYLVATGKEFEEWEEEFEFCVKDLERKGYEILEIWSEGTTYTVAI